MCGHCVSIVAEDFKQVSFPCANRFTAYRSLDICCFNDCMS